MKGMVNQMIQTSIGDTVFGGVVSSFSDAVDQLMQYIQNSISTRSEGVSQIQDVLYGMSWGYAEVLASWIVVALLLISVARPAFIKNTAQAFLVLGLITVAGSMWYVIGTGFTEIETWLIGLADFFTPTDDTGFELPTFESAYMTLMTVGGIAFLGSPIMIMYTGVDILKLVVTFLVLPALVIAVTGKRGSKFWNIVLSVTLLVMIFARPAGVLALDIGQWAIETLPLGDTEIAKFSINMFSLFLVFLFVGIAAVAAYHTPTWIRGMTSGMSKVSGDVTAKLQPGQKVKTEQVKTEMNRAVPMPVVIKNDTKPLSAMGKQRNQAIDKVVVATAAAASGSGGPVVGAAAGVAAGMVAQPLKAKPKPVDHSKR